MTSRRIIAGIGLLILTGCHGMAGVGMPTLTRTGEMKDVVIGEDLSPATLTVNPGDEIRWTLAYSHRFVRLSAKNGWQRRPAYARLPSSSRTITFWSIAAVTFSFSRTRTTAAPCAHIISRLTGIVEGRP